jgi:predicted HicB family RNase H-like nuclease
MSPKKRPKLSGEDLDDFFAATEVKRADSPYDQKYARHTYRIRTSLHQELKLIAKEKGVGLNDLVRYIFQTFIQQYKAGQIDLPIQEYVVTHSRLTD